MEQGFEEFVENAEKMIKVTEEKHDLGVEKKEQLEREAEMNDFFAYAEKPTGVKLELAAGYKRDESILSGKVERLHTSVSFGRVEDVDLLLVRTSEGIPVYVPQAAAGLYQPQNTSLLVGQEKILTISTLVEVKHEGEESEFIAVGSIQEAEFLEANKLYKEFKKDPEAFKKKKRKGKIQQILKGKNNAVLLNYQGLNIYVRRNDFSVCSDAFPFDINHEVNSIVDFRFTNANIDENFSKKYENKAEIKGTRHFFQGNVIDFLPTPDEKVKRLKNGDTIIGKIVQVNTVKGVLVEIEPLWRVKLIIPRHKEIELSEADAIEHTEVICTFESSNLEKQQGYTRRSGRVRFIDFVNGQAQKHRSM